MPEGGVRGIHVTGWFAGGNHNLQKMVNLVNSTRLNAMVIDIIDDGQLSYDADVLLAIKTRASRKMFRIDKVLPILNKNNIWPIARIACMRNTSLAEARPDLAIQTSKGGVWHDHSGYGWLNPYQHAVWDYYVDIALDCIKHGFKEIQFDYIRFPSDKLSTQFFPGRPADARRENQIQAFMRYARQKVNSNGAWFSVDVFGLTSLVSNDEGIGQRFLKVAESTDYLCPMVYPSHYHHGEYGIPDPDKDPYRIITVSVGDAKRKLKTVTTCKLRPWIQDFSLGNHYGPAQVSAQIKALKDLSIDEYLLWNPKCQYTAQSLGTKNSK